MVPRLPKEWATSLKGRIFLNPFNEFLIVVDIIPHDSWEDYVVVMNDQGEISTMNSILMIGLYEME